MISDELLRGIGFLRSPLREREVKRLLAEEAAATRVRMSVRMIEHECSRILTRIEPWRKRFPDVVVSCGPDDIRIACEGREVRVPLPDGALEWSLDDFSNEVLLKPLMNLTNYDPSLGG
jgi:hypothetical protein